MILECSHCYQGLHSDADPLLRAAGSRLCYWHHGAHQWHRGGAGLCIRNQGVAYVLRCCSVSIKVHKHLKIEFICSTHQKYLLLPSGSRSTPSTSIMSKCVPANQLGKIFSVTQALATLFGMAMKYANTQASIDISPLLFT